MASLKESGAAGQIQMEERTKGTSIWLFCTGQIQMEERTKGTSICRQQTIKAAYEFKE